MPAIPNVVKMNGQVYVKVDTVVEKVQATHPDWEMLFDEAHKLNIGPASFSFSEMVIIRNRTYLSLPLVKERLPELELDIELGEAGEA